ncbi:MAG TPA: TMEM175 family protein [Thermoanaerobaculia bacterium]|jgi:uncharacterized membrane protein|nr:TMEM175 family protein [Thermoanaerobaculia bacterium]
MGYSMPFRIRGREVSRVEAFSDVVFGFALTLIVVSLEVPTRYEDLINTLKGYPAFAICFAILTWIWFVHHTFFRRYALTDEITIALNTALLFLVLLYIYPLKYMFSIVTGQIEGRSNPSTLFIIYGLGFAGIFLLFFLMYVHALRLRDELDLNVIELHDTRTAMHMYASYVVIGLLSAAIGALASGRTMMWAGWIYFMIGPVSAIIGYVRGSARGRLVDEITLREVTESAP